MKRRDFLRLGLASAALVASWRAWPVPATADARFVLVFLRGAYDALSAVVPYADAFYHEARPAIALPAPDATNPQSVRPLDGRWGLHPAMEDSLWPFWEAQQLAFVPFAGTNFVSRSHFQAQDWVELGLAADVLRTTRPDSGSGFLNRLLLELGASSQGGQATRGRGIGFTQSLPLALRGVGPVLNSPLSRAGAAEVSVQHEALLLQMYAGHALEPMVQEGLSLRRLISSELSEEMQQASRQAVAAGSFALEAGRVGRFLQEHPEYRVSFVDVGGWDTHVGQGAAQGALANRLRALSEGLKALADALGPEWKQTVVVVMSEFGRTFRENGSKGTDHGHGSTLWVLGGALAGGAIRGEQTVMAAGHLHQDRDMPVLNEYRSVLAGLMRRQFALSDAALERIFPAARPLDLGLL